MRIYAAGKIAKNDWRHELFGLRGVGNGHDPTVHTIDPWPEEIAIADLPGASYVGPHFMSDDHGCYHGDNSHGVAAGDAACAGAYPGLTRPDVVKRCLVAVERATHLFVWLDDLTAYGTLVEVGYANALGRQIYLYTKQGTPGLDDLWMAGQVATHHGIVRNHREAWDDFRVRAR